MAIATVSAMVLLGGCPQEATQVLVTFAADPVSASRAQLMRVRIRAQDQAVRLDRTVRLGDGAAEVTLPTTVPVSPLGGDASRVFRIEGELLENEDEVFTEQRAIVGFVEHHRFEVHIRFDDRCIDRFECSPDQTCRAGRCVDAYVPRPGEDARADLTPEPCPIDPCRPTSPQCGCDTGQACRGREAPSCEAAGPRGLGDRCMEPTECGGGLTCWGGPAYTDGQCVPYCEHDADCAHGFCLGLPTVTTGVCLTMCTPIPDEDCPEGLTCALITGTTPDDDMQRSGSTCVPPGTVPIGGSCIESCEAGAICGSGTCLELCVLGAGSGEGCVEGGRCRRLVEDFTINGVSYGACR